MKPNQRRKSSLLWAVLFVLGCRSAFGDALERGDQMAALGRWDEAAAAYERAVSLEPGDEEANLKLKNAKRQQAQARVEKGNELLKAGKARDALVPFSEAVQLDRESAAAREGLERAKLEVVRQAEEAMGAARFKDAFDLARAVLLVEPGHAKARELESRARSEVTRAAVARAAAHEQAGNLAAASLDYGEAIEYSRENREALEALARVRAKLRDQVTYFIALKNFDGDQSADDLGADVNATVLAQGIDPKLPLRIVDKLDKKAANGTLQGMRLGGLFQAYRHSRSKTASSRSCDYICGTEWVPNPRYTTAEAEMRTAQAAVTTAEGRLANAKSAIAPAEQLRTSAEARLNQRKAEADRAEQDLSSCKSSSGGQANACSAQQQRRDQAAEDERVAEQELRSADQALSNARSEAQSAESDLSSKRSEAASRSSTFQSTPQKIEQDKHCTHSYAVETVVVSGEVSVALRGEALYSTDVVLNRGVTGRVLRSDETFPPQAGRCAEVASGDPLLVPSETEARKLVLASAIAETQTELLAAFQSYRTDYLTRGQAAFEDQKTSEGIDLMVRFLASLGSAPERGAAAEDGAIVRLSQAAAVSERAVRVALWGPEQL